MTAASRAACSQHLLQLPNAIPHLQLTTELSSHLLRSEGQQD